MSKDTPIIGQIVDEMEQAHRRGVDVSRPITAVRKFYEAAELLNAGPPPPEEANAVLAAVPTLVKHTMEVFRSMKVRKRLVACGTNQIVEESPSYQKALKSATNNAKVAEARLLETRRWIEGLANALGTKWLNRDVVAE